LFHFLSFDGHAFHAFSDGIFMLITPRLSFSFAEFTLRFALRCRQISLRRFQRELSMLMPPLLVFTPLSLPRHAAILFCCHYVFTFRFSPLLPLLMLR